MDGAWRVIGWMCGLIALYLLLYYSGGTAALSQGSSTFITSETKALQGR